MHPQRWRELTLVVAAATGALLAFAPLVSTSSCTSSSTGGSVCTSGQETLLEGEGSSALLVLAVPALVALVPVVARSPRWTRVSAVALTLAAVLGLASIGLFFVPTVALAWVAVAASRPRTADAVPRG